MSHNILKRRAEAGRSVTLAGMLLAVIFAAMVLGSPDWLRKLDFASYDIMIRTLNAPTPNPGVAVVDIDQKSLTRFGQWPWPRHLVARLLLDIARSEPAAVGLDVLFAEPDRTSVVRVREELREYFGLDLDISVVPPELRDNDVLLAEVVGAGEFLPGVMFRFEGDEQPTLLPLPGVTTGRLDRPGAPQSLNLPRATSAVPMIPGLLRVATGVGFVNSLPDDDGVIRRSQLYIGFGDRLYPSLALATVMRATGRGAAVLESDGTGITAVQLGRLSIPVDGQGSMLLRYSGPGGTYTAYSASDILEGTVGADELRGKVLFVGSSAEGLMDRHATPFDRVYPGVEIHATAAGAMLRGDFLRLMPFDGWSQVLAVVLGTLLMTLVIRRFSPVYCALALVLTVLVFSSGSLALLVKARVFLSPAPALVSLLTTVSLLSLVRFRSNENAMRQRDRQLAAARETSIVGLASLAETRDNETGKHILRTQQYVSLLARTMAGTDAYRDILDEDFINALHKTAPLHDIGKVGVPDAILKKPGSLTDEEFAEMKRHTVYGHEALVKAEALSTHPDESPFLVTARQIIISHHEKWDGTGYPNGLAGDEIPLGGRIMAVADVYDALVSRRYYKPPMTHEKAVGIILQGRSAHFDPAVVDAFMEIESAIREIAEKMSDD